MVVVPNLLFYCKIVQCAGEVQVPASVYVQSRVADPDNLVGSGSGCFVRIRIRVLSSDSYPVFEMRSDSVFKIWSNSVSKVGQSLKFI